MRFRWLAAFVGLALAASPAAARLATVDEVPLLVKSLERHTKVAGDGTSVDRWRWLLRVQRRDAREDVGTRSIRFYKSFETVKILKARTRTKGVWKETALSDVQERAVDDESPGFSSLSEYVLSFPDVQEGSELEFEYEIQTQKALEPGFWGQNFLLDSGVYEAFRWTIESARKLHWSQQDPFNAIRAESAAFGAGTRLVFRATRPLRMALADEVDAYFSNARKVHLLASFLGEWKEYGRHAAREFEKRLAGTLPDEDRRLLKSLQAVADPELRVQRILQHIHSHLRYFGDWRTSEQMHVPRTLDEIHRTQYGDCKDFALVAVRLMRDAGLEAKPVWVLNTEETPTEGLYRQPTDNAFNHVIVRVTLGGEARWIDPTNPAARVRFVSDEIAGRRGLVLDPEGSSLESIPRVGAGDYLTETEAVLERDAKGRTEVKIATRYRGFAAVTAGEQIRRDGATYFSDESAQRLVPSAALVEVRADVLDLDPETGDLRESRLQATFENFWVRTSAGPGFSPVREDVIERFRNLRLRDREGDIYLGKVYSYRESVRLTGFQLAGDLKLDCEVSSPWLDFSQRIERGPTGVVFVSRFDLKANEIPYDRASRARVAALQRSLRECAGRQLLLVKNN